jgi:hypothetical protein
MALSLRSARPKPPPLWFVTNGERTVGPVRTDLLLRGVVHKRIPDDCLVRELRWRSWRRLEQIREVGALGGSRPKLELSSWLEPAIDMSEVLLHALHAACLLTGADAGVCHRARGPLGRPVLSYARGAIAHARLGEVLCMRDPSIALAFAGEGTIGEPDDGPVELAILERLGSDAVAGVAMFPLLYGSELVGVVELGRSDHPFRERDADVFRSLAAAVEARLAAR